MKVRIKEDLVCWEKGDVRNDLGQYSITTEQAIKAGFIEKVEEVKEEKSLEKKFLDIPVKSYNRYGQYLYRSSVKTLVDIARAHYEKKFDEAVENWNNARPMTNAITMIRKYLFD